MRFGTWGEDGRPGKKQCMFELGGFAHCKHRSDSAGSRSHSGRHERVEGAWNFEHPLKNLLAGVVYEPDLRCRRQLEWVFVTLILSHPVLPFFTSIRNKPVRSSSPGKVQGVVSNFGVCQYHGGFDVWHWFCNISSSECLVHFTAEFLAKCNDLNATILWYSEQSLWFFENVVTICS